MERYGAPLSTSNTKKRWEFFLEYPDKSTTEYNRWQQDVNPVTTTIANGNTDGIDGYSAVHIDWTGNNWGGLSLSTSTNTFINGSVGVSSWWYAIGAYSVYQGGMPGPDSTRVGNVDLLARIDSLKEYTSPASLTRRVGVDSNGTYYVWVKDTNGNTAYKSVTVSNVDTTVPTATITYTTSTKASVVLKDNNGLSKYYIGTTNPSTTNVTYTSVSGTSKTITQTVNSTGTYYVSVVDKAGNRTITSKSH